MKKIVVLLFVSFLGFSLAQAQDKSASSSDSSSKSNNQSSSSTDIVEFTQPDGTVLHLILKGDDNFHWAELSDGYSVMHNKKKNAYEYAMLDAKHKMKISGVTAHEPHDRKKEDLLFLKKVSKKIYPTKAQKMGLEE